MPKTIKKEKWGKPKLIILTRWKPEEGVLTICKSAVENVDKQMVQTGCVYNGCGGV